MDFLTKEELNGAKGELIEVSYCGFGFTKTHVDLFKELTYPFFTNKIFHVFKSQWSVKFITLFKIHFPGQI